MAGQPPKPLSHFLAQSVGVLEQIGISRQKKRFLSLLREKYAPKCRSARADRHFGANRPRRNAPFVAFPYPRAPLRRLPAPACTLPHAPFRRLIPNKWDRKLSSPIPLSRFNASRQRGEAPFRPRCKVASRSVPAGRTGGCRRSRSSGPRWGCRCAPWHRRSPRCRRRARPSPAPPPDSAGPPRSRWGPR